MSQRVAVVRRLPSVWCCFQRYFFLWVLAVTVVILAGGCHARGDTQALKGEEPLQGQPVQLAVKDEEQVADEREDWVELDDGEVREDKKKEEALEKVRDKAEEKDGKEKNKKEGHHHHHHLHQQQQQQHHQFYHHQHHHQQQQQEETTQRENKPSGHTTSPSLRHQNETRKQHDQHEEEKQQQQRQDWKHSDHETRQDNVVTTLIWNENGQLELFSVIIVILVGGLLLYVGYLLIGMSPEEEGKKKKRERKEGRDALSSPSQDTPPPGTAATTPTITTTAEATPPHRAAPTQPFILWNAICRSRCPPFYSLFSSSTCSSSSCSSSYHALWAKRNGFLPVEIVVELTRHRREKARQRWRFLQFQLLVS